MRFGRLFATPWAPVRLADTFTRRLETAADTRLELTAILLGRALRSLLVLLVLVLTILAPFFSANKPGALVVITGLAVFTVWMPFALLGRGKIMEAAWAFCVTGAVLFTILVCLSGGMRSPGIVFQLVMGVTAVVLIGRGALYLCGALVAMDAILALGQRTGIELPLVFPGTPFTLWRICAVSMIIVVPPVYEAVAWLAAAAVAYVEQRNRAEQANRLKSEVLANMNHELRTPMNAILELTDLAMRASSVEEQAECLKEISRAGQKLLSLLNDILNLSQLQEGRTELTPEPLSIAYLRTSRQPFPIAVKRQARRKLLVAVAENVLDAEVRTRELSPGEHFELCDIEGESALLRIGPNWYRAHIDEVLNHTVPVASGNSEPD